MQRQRDGLVPIGEALADLPGPVKALRKTPPPARRGFTVADQVNQLVSASEADPDRGFMARTMALCSLPRSNPGNRLQYKRVNGPFTLYMTVTGGNKLPFDNLPRLILAWLCTEAVRTQNRELVLGKSLADFMRALGVYSTSGGKYTRLRNQMKRLGVAEDQAGLAGVELLDGSGGLDPASLDTGHPSVIRPGPSRGIAISRPLNGPSAAFARRVGLLYSSEGNNTGAD